MSDLRQKDGVPVPERPLEDVMSGKGFAGVALLLLLLLLLPHIG